MIMNPFQAGPCSLSEALTLISKLGRSLAEGLFDRYDVFSAVATIRKDVLALGKSRAFPHDVDTHEDMHLPYSKRIDENWESEAPESLELPYRKKGDIDQGNIEAIALYLPKCVWGSRYGIYLHAGRLIDLAFAIEKAGHSAGEVTRDRIVDVVIAVAVHELFHAYMEESMDPARYVAHLNSVSGWCMWEEAAANRAGVDWARVSGANTAEFQRRLFPIADSGGLPGYGDWAELTSDITLTVFPPKRPGVVPLFTDYAALLPFVQDRLGCGNRIIRPDWVLELYTSTLQPPAPLARVIQHIELWRSMHERFLDTSGQEIASGALLGFDRPVPVYVDLVPWGKP